MVRTILRWMRAPGARSQPKNRPVSAGRAPRGGGNSHEEDVETADRPQGRRRRRDGVGLSRDSERREAVRWSYPVRLLVRGSVRTDHQGPHDQAVRGGDRSADQDGRRLVGHAPATEGVATRPAGLRRRHHRSDPGLSVESGKACSSRTIRRTSRTRERLYQALQDNWVQKEGWGVNLGSAFMALGFNTEMVPTFRSIGTT